MTAFRKHASLIKQYYISKNRNIKQIHAICSSFIRKQIDQVSLHRKYQKSFVAPAMELNNKSDNNKKT